MARTALIAAVIGLTCASSAFAQRGPIRCFDVTDGLVQSESKVIFQDSRGYIWIGTAEGVSRFDGYRFVNYGLPQGLGHAFINDIYEDRHGHLWVATNGGGVSRLAGQGMTPFVTFRPGKGASNQVNALVEDPDGNLWLGTDAGLFRGVENATGEMTFEPITSYARANVTEAFRDSRDRLWFWVRGHGILRVTRRGMRLYTQPPDLARMRIHAFAQDARGKVYAAAAARFFALEESSSGDGEWVEMEAGIRPARGTMIRLKDSETFLMPLVSAGIVMDDGTSKVLYPSPGGAGTLADATSDRDGNLWVGGTTGVCRISPEPIVSFTTLDGLPSPHIGFIVQGPDGRIYADTPNGLVEIAGETVSTVEGTYQAPFDEIGPRIVPTRQGDWWVATRNTLMHLKGPRLRFTGRDASRVRERIAVPSIAGPGSLRAAGLYEDHRGWIWFTDRAGRLHHLEVDPVSGRAELKSHETVGVGFVVMAGHSASDTLWFGSMSQFARRVGSRFEMPPATEGLPEPNPRGIYVDRRGWLWMALRNRGVSVTRDPGAPRPVWTNYSTVDGLASDSVMSIAEDRLGHMYFATGRGLDRFDPRTNTFRHFTTDDGLAGNKINHLLEAHDGAIWIATNGGLSKLDPRVERTGTPPQVFLSAVQIAGETQPLPEAGTTDWSSGRLPFSRNNLVIEYVGLNFRRDEALRYQYRLDGVDREWSEPTSQRSVNYARLAPGAYRFHVRAIDLAGRITEQPATLTFQIAPPLWQSPWLISLLLGVTIGAAIAFHRVRVRHAVEVEKVRRRMATDLHDDIGSGLSQIAILSEVERRHAVAVSPHLGQIADLARGLRTSMDDIVWAVDPRNDHLLELVARIREAAFNALEADGLRVDITVPHAASLERIDVDPDKRRHLLMIAKEAITNIARHARASHVEIDVQVEGSSLRLRIRDNGRGFEIGAARGGDGLRNISLRAAAMGGTSVIQSAPGGGTFYEITVPLA